jgi:hypothetical protein
MIYIIFKLKLFLYDNLAKESIILFFIYIYLLVILIFVHIILYLFDKF